MYGAVLIWKFIKGYEGLYQVSDSGQIRSVSRKVSQISRYGSPMVRTYAGKPIVPRVGNRGYLYVNLSKGGKKKSYKVHRLVAFEFCSGFVEGFTVNHKDGDKLNNSANNLEWISSLDNLKHSREAGLKPKNEFGIKSPNFKGTIQVILDGHIFAELNGTREIREFGLNPSTVSAVICGRLKKYGCFTFKRKSK